MADMQTWKGGRHCGKVAFEVDVAIEQAISRNCSIGHKRGLVLGFAGEEQFRLKSGDEMLTGYLFNAGKINHLFCKVCGVESFARGRNPKDGAPVIALNLRCLDGFDPDSVPIRKFDGASL